MLMLSVWHQVILSREGQIGIQNYTWSFLNEVLRALVSSQQNHFRGMIHQLLVTIYRMCQILYSKWGVTPPVAAANTHPLQQTPIELLIGQKNLTKTTLNESWGKAGSDSELECLFHRLQIGLDHLKLAVAKDVHDCCNEIKRSLKDDLIPSEA